MGNKLCKKRVDGADNPKTSSAIDRIINKFTQRQKWKSDTNLEEKQINSYQVNAKRLDDDKVELNSDEYGLSKSSEWTDIPLEVPQKIEPSYGKNNNICNDNEPPIPPPRKKKSLKETLGSLIQYNKPIEEAVMTKKTFNYKCACCERGLHKPNKPAENKITDSLKESKKRKTPSIASLPNYNEFKLSVAGETNIDKPDLEKHSSAHSLPDESKKLSSKSSSDKIDNYLTRARSFGSLLPTMLLHKMSTAKAPLAEIESDDSLGGLDDWGGLNMIEHYKPRDSSLPRPRRQKTEAEIIAEIEKQLVDCESSPQVVVEDTSSQKTVAAVSGSRSDGVIEHSGLMKILEKYSDKNENDPDRNKAAGNKHSINDFLNAERAHFTTDFAKTVHVNGAIAT